jgi:hypothetical protein
MKLLHIDDTTIAQLALSTAWLNTQICRQCSMCWTNDAQKSDVKLQSYFAQRCVIILTSRSNGPLAPIRRANRRETATPAKRSVPSGM